MTEAIDEAIDFFENIDKIIDETIIELLKENEKVIIQMNIDQLYSGIDNDGVKIKPPYKPSTIKRKKKKGQPFNRVTTRDEGDHHESLFVVFGQDEFEIDTEDFKKQYLVRKYGKKLYGLTEENIENLRSLIRDDLSKAIKEKFNLK